MKAMSMALEDFNMEVLQRQGFCALGSTHVELNLGLIRGHIGGYEENLNDNKEEAKAWRLWKITTLVVEYAQIACEDSWLWPICNHRSAMIVVMGRSMIVAMGK